METYVETLVAKKRNLAAGLLKIVCGGAAVLAAFGMTLSFVLLAAAVVFGGLAYYFYLEEWVEYEYSYVSRELTIDKIMARSRRKKQEELSLDKMEIGAPTGSYHLDNFRGRACKTRDYSSGRTAKTFEIYYEGNRRIVLEADERLMQALRNAAPGRMFLD